MPSSIFTKIFDDNIKRFINDFGNMPRQLFYDEDENLFHPGEYGKFREEIIRRFFRTILYEGLTVSEGFIINMNNQHSTQCDIIIYDKSHTPILKDSNEIFVPVETSVGVGEVKSTLSKMEFKSALRKLAKNKELKEYADGRIIKRGKPGNFDAKDNFCDQLFSFLICKKLDFKIDNIDFEDIYEGIEHRNRHNLILSLEDGLFDYKFHFDMVSLEERKIYKQQNFNLQKNLIVDYPNWLKATCPHNFIPYEKDNPLQHIREFISSLSNGIHYSTLLEVDIRQYYRVVPRDLIL